MKFSVSPIVRVAVEACKATESSQLSTALQRLVKVDPCATYAIDQSTGQTVLCGVGELHLEICLSALREQAGIEIRASDPVVQYCETVMVQGPVCLAKSSNKHNRVYIRASPLSAELTNDVETGKVSMTQEASLRTATLSEGHGWGRDAARKIMAISSTCILLDSTTGVSLAEIRDNLVSSFTELASSGPLAAEQMRGVLFEVVDVKYHSDSVHRRADQICPMMRRACFAALLTSSPRLTEPVSKLEVSCPDTALAAVCRVIKKRQGQIVDDICAEGTPVHTVKSTMAVANSFGFCTELRSATSGRAFAQCSFSHWQVIDDDPLKASSSTSAILRDIRTRKGASASVPPLSDYLDTL